jgi:hypothetical protein
MRSPTFAIAWQLWGRHRWGLAVVLAYLFVVALLFQALPAGTLEPTHGILCSIQFVLALAYVAAVFAYGFDSHHLEGKESGFPVWMFKLPVRTSVLVGWPMLQGMAAIVLLWVSWAYFVLRPSGIEVSLGSTALLAAALVAVLQALLWLPFGLPWIRILVLLLVLPLLLSAPQLGLVLGATEAELLCLFAILIPVAFVVAFTGVVRARRGDGPEWQRLFEARAERTHRDMRQLRPFPSPVRAQLWFELRRHLLPFPIVVGCAAALHLAFILWAEQGEENKVKLWLPFLCFPPLMASFFGGGLGRTGTSAGNPFLLSSFTATRPVTCATLVASKLKAAALATLAAWAVLVVSVAVWYGATQAHEQMSARWGHLLQAYSAWKLCAASLLAVSGLFLLTWKQLVANLCIGLTGRAWLVRGTAVAFGIVVTLAMMLLARLTDRPAFSETFWDALPWWVAGGVCLKLLGAAGALRALVRSRLVETPTLTKLLSVWLLLAGGLFGLAYAIVPAGAVPVSLLAGGIVLSVPLTSLAAAPLALAWNRHR